MNNQFDVEKVQLEIVTPCCVSNGVKLSPNDYFYDAITSTMYFVRQNLWHKFIMEKNLFDKYVQYVEQPESTKTNLLTWLRLQGYDLADIRSMILYQVHADPSSLQAEEKETLNTVMEHIRLADGSVYIPGSSVKGFVRTALLAHLIQKNQTVRDVFWRKIEECVFERKPLNKLKKQLKDITGDLETELLHKLSLMNDHGKQVQSKNAVCSVTRGLQISDMLPVGNVETEVMQKIDYVAGTDIGDNPLPLYRECVVAGSVFQGSIKIDRAMMALVGIKSIAELLTICSEFEKNLQAYFQDVFGKEIGDVLCTGDANIYLGGNTGFLSKTLFLALAPKDAAKNCIKCLLQAEFGKNHSKKDTVISPRTLKATYDGYRDIQMGLANLAIVK